MSFQLIQMLNIAKSYYRGEVLAKISCQLQKLQNFPAKLKEL